MKKILILLSAMVLMPLCAEDLSLLDKELDERIELNKQYKIDYTEMAKESAMAGELVPLEEKNGQDWVDFITYVRKSDDPVLKLYVLKIELQGELTNYLYDLEYAETMQDRAEAVKQAQVYREKLAALKKFEENMNKESDD